MKPLNGNDCDVCPKRFKCLTSKQQKVCPTVLGKDINDVYLDYYYNYCICVTLEGRRFRLIVSKQELLKLLKSKNYDTTSNRMLKIKEKDENKSRICK